MAKDKAVSDEQIIAAIMANNTFQGAAEACGITARTIRERMKDAGFRADYKAARDEVLRSAVKGLTDHLNEAVETVAEIMNDNNVNPATRLQAAQTILNNSIKLSDSLTGHEDKTRKENASLLDNLIWPD